MKTHLTLFATLLLSTIIFPIMVYSQDSTSIKRFNTRRNFLMVNLSTGGGDYPFGGIGLSAHRQFFNGNSILGVGAHYIASSVRDGLRTDIEGIQLFPILIDVRQKFTESANMQFATFFTMAGGYIVSITGNKEDQHGPFEFLNGWTLNPGVSFRFSIFKNLGVMADITWMHQVVPRKWKLVDRHDVQSWDVALLRGNIFF